MEFIYYLFIGYLIGVVIIAARLGWHMAFRLDKFDWHWAKDEIWITSVVCTVLWPLMLLKPRNLVDPSTLMAGSYDAAARFREEARLWDNPPPCGRLIRYRPHKIVASGGDGEFIFHSSDFEEAILVKLQDHPDLAKDQLSSVLKWLSQRDDSVAEPTPVPDGWWKLHDIAYDVLRKGRGEIRCLTCNQQVPNNLLRKSDISGQPGWNFNQLSCPRGHTLLRAETMHIFVGSRSAVKPECDGNNSVPKDMV
jgi:hypothetical protein